MPKFKATKKFKKVGTENSYHYLSCEQYFALKACKTVEINLSNRNQYLIEQKYLERLPEKINQNVKGA